MLRSRHAARCLEDAAHHAGEDRAYRADVTAATTTTAGLGSDGGAAAVGPGQGGGLQGRVGRVTNEAWALTEVRLLLGQGRVEACKADWAE